MGSPEQLDSPPPVPTPAKGVDQERIFSSLPLMKMKHEKEEEEEEEVCRTPTSTESKLCSIPLTCPPAPRKGKRVIGCKRRLSEFEIFAVTAEEVERAFRPRDPLPLRRAKKPKSCDHPKAELL